MFGWIQSALKVAVSLVKLLKGGGKVTLSEVLPTLVGQLLPAVQAAIRYQGLDSKAKFDAWLGSVDQATGTDLNGLDLVKNLPAELEERFFDHLIEAARIYGYCLLKVEGYYQA